MALDLNKRSEVSTYLTQTQVDANWTALEGAIDQLGVNVLSYLADGTDKDKILDFDNTQTAATVTTMLTDAIAACKTNGWKNLVFPTGLYVFNDTTIDNLDDFHFIGLGATIQYNSGDAIWEFTNSTAVEIRGFKFTSTESSYSDVSFLKIYTDSGFFNIHHNIFENFPRSAIRLESLFDNGGAETKGCFISNNIFRDSDNYSNDLQCAISCLDDGEYSKIMHNEFRDVPSAVRFLDGANACFAFNDVLLCNGDAYDSSYTNAIVYVDDNTNNGKIDIVYNKFNHNTTGMAAIVVKDVSGFNACKIIGNDILVHGSASKRDTIYLDSAPNTLISKNKIRGTDASVVDSGIIVNDSIDVVIESNNIANYVNGVELTGTSTNVDLRDNQFVTNITNEISVASTSSFKANESFVVAVSDETTAITTGTGKVTFRMPYRFFLNDVRASLTGAGSTSGTTTFDINEGGSTILSTKLTIDQGEKTSTTAATAVVISDRDLADDSEITIDVDAVTGGADETGGKITFLGTRI